MINFIKEIETRFAVSTIKVEGLQVWPFLRVAYFFAYFDNNYKKEVSPLPTNSKLAARMRKIKNSFYGIENLFKIYSFIIFSNTYERRSVDGKFINKIAESLISELGKERVLVVEIPVDGLHFKRADISTHNIISMDLFNLSCYLFSFWRKNLVIDKEVVLKEINSKYGLNVDYHRLIKKFFCYKSLFALFYRAGGPKAIFISCYYSIVHQAAIYAAKKMGIKAIELQHGLINKEHFAYNFFADLDSSFFPDYLFAFGDYVKDQQNYIDPENVIPIGNMYIDYIKNKYQPSEKTIELFKSFRNNYKKIVSISSQWPLEDKLIEFLKKSASLNNSILYIFVPRDLTKDYSFANFPANIVILKNLDVYQIIRESNFHSTLWSTCALEAPALGIPNILINIAGTAKEYYADMLTNKDVTRFVETEDEYVNTILTWQPKSKQEIMKLHSNFYEVNHEESLRAALQRIEIK